MPATSEGEEAIFESREVYLPFGKYEFPLKSYYLEESRELLCVTELGIAKYSFGELKTKLVGFFPCESQERIKFLTMEQSLRYLVYAGTRGLFGLIEIAKMNHVFKFSLADSSPVSLHALPKPNVYAVTYGNHQIHKVDLNKFKKSPGKQP